jgi:hypothetical protein
VVSGVTSSPFPLRQINLPVTFRDASNYHNEVVDFSRPFHIMLGQPCYINFMVIPSYAYLKLKILGLASIIIVEAKAQWALDCEQNSIELAVAMVAATKLKELCRNGQPSSANPAMPSTTNTYKAAEDAKVIQVDVEGLTKTVQIGAGLSPK